MKQHRALSRIIAKTSAISFVLAGLLPAALLAQDIQVWGDDPNSPTTDIPTGTDFVQIASGRNHALAVSVDGSLVSWGADDGGQATNTPAGNDFVKVAGGWRSSFALREDGSIVFWGLDSSGVVSGTPTGTGFTHIASMWDASLALRTDGSMWGRDRFRKE